MHLWCSCLRIEFECGPVAACRQPSWTVLRSSPAGTAGGFGGRPPQMGIPPKAQCAWQGDPQREAVVTRKPQRAQVTRLMVTPQPSPPLSEEEIASAEAAAEEGPSAEGFLPEVTQESPWGSWPMKAVVVAVGGPATAAAG